MCIISEDTDFDEYIGVHLGAWRVRQASGQTDAAGDVRHSDEVGVAQRPRDLPAPVDDELDGDGALRLARRRRRLARVERERARDRAHQREHVRMLACHLCETGFSIIECLVLPEPGNGDFFLAHNRKTANSRLPADNTKYDRSLAVVSEFLPIMFYN